MLKKALPALLLVLSSSIPAGLAATLRVPLDQMTVQGAIDAARDGDVVLVARGEYMVTEPVSFRGKAITLRSEDGPDVTAIRMDHPPLDSSRASVVVFESGEGDAALEGLTLTGGLGSEWGESPNQKGGGGILCRNSSHPTITHCVFSGNNAQNGGGIMVDEDCSATIADCTFTGNSALTYGGGILWVTPSLAPTLKSSSFTGNFGGAGGALFCKFGASPEIMDCTITGNLANGPGGAICCLVGSSPTLTNCSFLGNSAGVGGALSLETSGDSPTLINCTLVGNFAFAGGALVANDGSSPKLMNCTIYGNGAQDENGGIECVGAGTLPSVVNTILWNNLPDSVCGDTSFLLTDDPGFVRSGVFDLTRTRKVEVGGIERQMPDFLLDPGDYRLKAGSPAIDAGKAEGAPSTDLRGQSRPCGHGVDIGAYEFCEAVSEARFIRGDANQDGRRDISDASFILNFLFLGGPPPDCSKSADSNDSGKVDLSDPVYLLRFLFSGGAPIPEPVTSCGVDPTSDELSCESFASCSA